MDRNPGARHGLDGRQVRRAVTRAGMRAFEATYQPRSRLPEHQHALPYFCYVLRGEFAEHADGAVRECCRGSVVFHRGHDQHANVVGPRGTVSLNVELEPETWRELTDDLMPDRHLVGRVLGGDVEWHALVVWREFHSDDEAGTLGMHEAVALLCASARDLWVRGAYESHRRLDRCREYLAEHSTGAPRLADAARLVGVHPVYLARLFRQRFGCSMGEFVRRRRVAWACEELLSGQATIASVATRAGFADHAHFTRTFRRLTGCSPAWYRRHVAGGRGGGRF